MMGMIPNNDPFFSLFISGYELLMFFIKRFIIQLMDGIKKLSKITVRSSMILEFYPKRPKSKPVALSRGIQIIKLSFDEYKF